MNEEEQNESQQEEPEGEEVDNQQPPQQQEEEGQEPTEDEEDNSEEEGEETPEDEGEADGSDGSGGDEGEADGADGSGGDTTYDEEAMREARDRKIIFDRLTDLRTILTTLSRHSEELYSTKDSFASVTTLPKNVWKKISYVNEVSEQKIDQITTILRTDIITKLDVERLYKVFLALQRITSELIDILERADYTLYPSNKQ